MASQEGPVSGLAERYASAFYDLASDRKALDATAQDLRSIKAMLGSSEDLRRLLRSPLVGRDEQAHALDAVLTQCRRFPGPVWELGANYFRQTLL